MAKKVTELVEYTDDLDGSKAEGTVAFTYDGTAYELELSKKNKGALDKALKPYVDAARRVRATRASAPRRSASTAAGRKEQIAAIRDWAKEQGLQVAERGRISAEVTSAYEAAH